MLAPHPRDAARRDLFWIVGGRVADWGELRDRDELARRTALALGARPAAGPAVVPPEAVHELRIVATWLDSNPATPVLSLDPAPDTAALERFAGEAGNPAPQRFAGEARNPALPASGPGFDFCSNGGSLPP